MKAGYYLLIVLIGKCIIIGFGLNGIERTTIIVDIFNIIHKGREAGIHLNVDEDQGKITQGSKRQANGYKVPTCTMPGLYSSAAPVVQLVTSQPSDVGM